MEGVVSQLVVFFSPLPTSSLSRCVCQSSTTPLHTDHSGKSARVQKFLELCSQGSADL